MEKGKQPREKDENESLDIDFGLGKLSLGGLFGGVEKLVDLAARLKEADGEINQQGEIDLSRFKEGMKGIFGFSVKTAVGGKPVVEPFGNIKKTAKGPTVEEKREPITDVFDEKDEVLVYVEMPGVNEQDIKLDLRDDILTVSANTGDKKYYKEILLSSKVNPANLKSSYKNGILEARIKK